MSKLINNPLNHVLTTRLNDYDYNLLFKLAKTNKSTIAYLIRKIIIEYIDKTK